MAADFVATATIVVESTPEDIWDALIDPDRVRQYMFGTNVVSDWEVGLAITWQGEWNGKPYQDKGEVLEIEPHRRLRYSHYSPMSGEPDLPENYHTVTVDLTQNAGTTTVTLTQDNNDSEQARDHSEANWQTMLDGLKEHVEGAE